jgi:hypothetical protein
MVIRLSWTTCKRNNFEFEQEWSNLIICLNFMTGTQWLHSQVDINGYEEYSGIEYRSTRCTEEYTVLE